MDWGSVGRVRIAWSHLRDGVRPTWERPRARTPDSTFYRRWTGDHAVDVAGTCLPLGLERSKSSRGLGRSRDGATSAPLDSGKHRPNSRLNYPPPSLDCKGNLLSLVSIHAIAPDRSRPGVAR